MNAFTYTPMTLTKIKGFDHRKRGTLHHHGLNDEVQQHQVVVVTMGEKGRTRYNVYVEVKPGEYGFAGFVHQVGIGYYRLVHRQYGQRNSEVGNGYTDHGKVGFFVEQIAHGYLTSREYYLSKEA